jgi:hypothetical protein
VIQLQNERPPRHDPRPAGEKVPAGHTIRDGRQPLSWGKCPKRTAQERPPATQLQASNHPWEPAGLTAQRWTRGRSSSPTTGCQ